MSPSYIAFPTITPSILFKFLAFLISVIDETPPDITTGQLEIFATNTFEKDLISMKIDCGTAYQAIEQDMHDNYIGRWDA